MSSPAHELAHVLRRRTAEIVGDETFAALEREIAGITGTPIKGGVWKVEHEEVFARMAERWLREGRAPSPHSWDVFRKLSDELAAVYPRVTNDMPEVTPTARRVLERSFDPASGVEAPGAAFRSSVPVGRQKANTSPSRSTLRRSAQEEFGTAKQSSGRLFVEAREAVGPTQVVADFQRTARATTKILAIEKLKQFATKWDYERQAIPEGYSPIFFKAGESADLPRVFKEEADYADRMPNEYGRMLREEENALLARHFPTEEEVRAGGVPEGAEVYLIPTKIKDAYTGGDLRGGKFGGPLMEHLGRALDYTNATTKAAVVYGKLSYIPVNFAGNLLFLGIHSGAFAGPALVRSSKLLGRLPADDLMKMDFWVGEGQYAKLATERGGKYLEGIHSLAMFQTSIADRLPRRAAFIYSAGKRGYTKKSELHSLLTDPKHRDDLEAIALEAREAMVNFDGLTRTERDVISRLVFVYGWIRGATRYGKHLFTEMPLRADLIYNIGEQGAERTQEELGKLEDYMRGIVPFGEKFEKLGVEAITIRNLRAINPISTAAETLELALNLMPDTNAESQGAQAMDYLTPPLKMMLEYVSGYNFFFGEKYDSRGEALTQPARWPLVKLGKELVDPTVSVGDLSDTPAATRKNYIPAESAGEARKQALEEWGLGGLATRDLDVEAVKARAEDKLEEQDFVTDYKATLAEAGLEPNAEAIRQAELFDRLSDDDRMKRNSPTKQKVIAMAEALGDPKVLAYVKTMKTEAEADRALELLGKQMFGTMRAYENQAEKIIDSREEE